MLHKFIVVVYFLDFCSLPYVDMLFYVQSSTNFINEVHFSCHRYSSFFVVMVTVHSLLSWLQFPFCSHVYSTLFVIMVTVCFLLKWLQLPFKCHGYSSFFVEIFTVPFLKS